MLNYASGNIITYAVEILWGCLNTTHGFSFLIFQIRQLGSIRCATFKFAILFSSVEFAEAAGGIMPFSSQSSVPATLQDIGSFWWYCIFRGTFVACVFEWDSFQLLCIGFHLECDFSVICLWYFASIEKERLIDDYLTYSTSQVDPLHGISYRM